MSLCENISKNSFYLDDVNDFPDLQTAYDSLWVKSAKLLDFGKRLVKKVKSYEKELNELKIDQQLIEQTKAEKLALVKINKQLEAEKTKFLGNGRFSEKV